MGENADKIRQRNESEAAAIRAEGETWAGMAE